MSRKIFSGILLVLILSSAIYHKWLSFSIYTFSDWTFYFNETLSNFLAFSAWNNTFNLGFGELDLLLWKLPFYTAYGVFGALGHNINIVDKFIVFWPIILILPLGSFLLVRKITKSDIGAFVGSLVLTYNTYFLSINTQGHEVLTLGFIISIFALLFFIKLLEERTLSLALVVALFLFVTGFYDLRSLYIITGVFGLYLILYFFTINNLKLNRRFLLLPALAYVLLGLLNTYWLLPSLFSSALTSNIQLGRLISFSEFYKLQHAISLHFPFWTGSIPRWEMGIPIPWLFWLYPIFAVLGLIVNRKNANIVFFGLVSLIGILLTKQIHIPFDGLYFWLYNNIPGFNAFREASKFYFLIALGYSVLIGGFIAYIWEHWRDGKWKLFGKYTLTICIAALALWNAKPIITGEIGTLFIPKEIPKDIITTKDFIFDQEEFFRTFWIHPSGRWNLATNNHPMIDAETIMRTDWKEYLPYQFTPRGNEGEVVMNNMNTQRMDVLLDLSSVKYVMLLLDDQETDDYIINSLGKSGDYFVDGLNKIEYLKKIDIGTEQILVFENLDFRPHIYATSQRESLTKNQELRTKSLSYEMINPSEYKVKISNISNPVFFNFTDNFHPSWKMRVGEFHWTSVISSNGYFVSDSAHTKNAIGFNEFALDPEKICKEFGCKRNNDGSYDIEMTLYFAPQAYLYLGIIISGTTFVGIIGGLLYTIVRNKRKNGKA